jgi:hypothetical protein
MNGAIAVPLVNTMRPPSKTKEMMIGNNQNFFLSFRKPHISFANSMVPPD